MLLVQNWRLSVKWKRSVKLYIFVWKWCIKIFNKGISCIVYCYKEPRPLSYILWSLTVRYLMPKRPQSYEKHYKCLSWWISVVFLTCTQVTGELLDHLSSWDALRAALPVGTVSGAPKVISNHLCFLLYLFHLFILFNIHVTWYWNPLILNGQQHKFVLLDFYQV